MTYLGHQGWAFETPVGSVLIDPVFRTIGNAGVQLPIWPDREIDPAKIGQIAGLIISHEHSDHFDIDTLYRMPYRGDVYISDRSSRSVATILTEMGYSVKRMKPYQVLAFPSARVTVLPLEESPMEPDSYGFLVQADDGTSFFTGVDGLPHEQTLRWLRKNCPNRTIDNFTNNYMEQLPELTGVSGMDGYSAGFIMSCMIDAVQNLTPSHVLLSGQGWSYPPEYSELNHRFFNVTHQKLLPILSEVYPNIKWEAPEPGTRMDLSGESISGTPAHFITHHPITKREYEVFISPSDGLPWSRVTALPDPDMKRLIEFTETKLGHLIATHSQDLMKRLYELSALPGNNLAPTIALRLRDDSGARHYVLDPGWLEFVPASGDLNIRTDVAGGIEIWASDLLLLIDGLEEPYLVYETAVRRWSNAPEDIGRSLHVHLFMAFGPRFQQIEFERSYRRRLACVREQADAEEGEN